MIQHQVLKQNYQYKQKSETVYVSSMRLLVNCVFFYLINKLQFYFFGLWFDEVYALNYPCFSIIHSTISPQLPMIIESTLYSI